MASASSKSEPCYLCRHLGLGETPGEFHHIQGGMLGKRGSIGVWLCPYHHRLGPVSIHTMGKKAWRKKYGLTEQELLDKYKEI